MIPIGLKERTEVFDNVVKLTAARMAAPSFDPAKWRVQADSRRELILAAGTSEDLEGAIRKLFSEVKASHVVFFHQSLQSIAPQYAIGATFQPYPRGGTSRWMFQDVHEGSPPAIGDIQPGDLLLEIDQKPITPPELPTFRLGGMCEIRVEKLSPLAQGQIAPDQPPAACVMVEARAWDRVFESGRFPRPSRNRRGARNRPWHFRAARLQPTDR